MRRIAQPWAAKVKIASRSFTWSMLAIVATHTPGLAGQCAALWHPSRWYILKPFISFPAGTLSVTADILGAQPGDVLIYAPTRKMNRKEAEMNVLWEGHPTQFKNIDDPVVRPRLNATLDAHKLLWSIRLLVRRSLTPAQQQLALDLCEIELLSHTRERTEKQRTLYSQVVQKALATENRRIPSSATEHQERVGKIVRELMVTGHRLAGEGERCREAGTSGRGAPRWATPASLAARHP